MASSSSRLGSRTRSSRLGWGTPAELSSAWGRARCSSPRIFRESGQLAIVTRDGFQVQTLEGVPLQVEAQVVPWDPVSAEKGEYKHFMLKEIFEQVRSTTDTTAGRVA